MFCCGKVYFDLQEERVKRGQEDVAIVRIEQLNPFPWEEVKAVLKRYDKVTEVFWVQEEPINMGSWDFTEPKLRKLLEGRLPVQYAGRKPSASTATGVIKLHLEELEAFVGEALTLKK